MVRHEDPYRNCETTGSRKRISWIGVNTDDEQEVPATKMVAKKRVKTELRKVYCHTYIHVLCKERVFSLDQKVLFIICCLRSLRQYCIIDVTNTQCTPNRHIFDSILLMFSMKVFQWNQTLDAIRSLTFLFSMRL